MHAQYLCTVINYDAVSAAIRETACLRYLTQDLVISAGVTSRWCIVYVVASQDSGR